MLNDQQHGLAAEYTRLWRESGQALDLNRFLSERPQAPLSDRQALLMVDQSLRAERGQFRKVESYASEYPELCSDHDFRATLAANEFEQLAAHGASPDLDTFVSRFPELKHTLRDRLAQSLNPAATVANNALPQETIAQTSPGALPENRGDTIDMQAPLDAHLDQLLDATRGDTIDMQAPLDATVDVTLAWQKTPGSDEGQTQSATAGRIGEFGDYDLLKEIARGGMGVVYLARQRRLKRLVALKMILSGQLASDDEVQRFLAEAEAAAQLEHPNIVPIYEVGEREGKHYFSMAYVEGSSLSNVVREGPMLPRAAAEMMLKIVAAVEYAHERGIVHRDLKPANILLDNKGEPRVTDFGLAKNVASDSGLTASGQIMGTPSYMPPEQAAGRIEQIGPVSDVYSLGAILYELLAGRPPFRAATLLDTLKQVLEQEPVAPRMLNSSIDRDLETICLKCLSKDAKGRYATARELSDELQRYLNGEPIHARRIGLVGRAVRWCKRKPILAGMCAAVVLALVAISLAVWSNRAANRVKVLADLKTEFESELDREDLTPSHLDKMEAIAKAISAFDPAEGDDAKQRSYMRFAETIDRATRKPRLSTADADEIRRSIDALALRTSDEGDRLRQILERRMTGWLPSFELTPPFANAAECFDSASTKVDGSVLRRVTPPGLRREKLPGERYFDIPDQSLPTSVDAASAARLEVTFDEAWQTSSQIGLWLNLSDKREGYQFLMRITPRLASQNDSADAEDGPTEQTATSFAKARENGIEATLEISKASSLLARRSINLESLGDKDLAIMVTRQRDELAFQINTLEAFRIRDPFPLSASQPGRFGVDWPSNVGIRRLRGSLLANPPDPGPLQRADELYDQGDLSNALELYSEVERMIEDVNIREEAAYKSGICLLGLGRNSEASEAFIRVISMPGEVWPLLSGVQVWLTNLRAKNTKDADVVFETLSSRFRSDQIATLLPPDARDEILKLYFGEFDSYMDLLRFDPAKLDRVKRAADIDRFLSYDGRGKLEHQLVLSRAYRFVDDFESALTVARTVAKDFPKESGPVNHLTRLLRLTGRPQQAVDEVNDFLNRNGDRNLPYLLVMRARALAVLADWENAEADVDTVLASRQLRTHEATPAALMKGFLLRRRGEEVTARRVWSEVFQQYREAIDSNPHVDSGTMNLLILGSLTGELSEADSQKFLATAMQTGATNSLATAIQSMLNPQAFANATRAMWRSDRGMQLAERFAFESVTVSERTRFPLVLLGYEYFHQNAVLGDLSPDHDEALWRAMNALYDAALETGELGSGQLMQLALTWKGSAGIFGWGGVAPTLSPTLRANAAYIFAHRYVRRNDLAQAKTFFEDVIANSAEDSFVRRAVEKDLTLLGRGVGVIRFINEYPESTAVLVTDSSGTEQEVRIETNADIEVTPGRCKVALRSEVPEVTLSVTEVDIALAAARDITIDWRWLPHQSDTPLLGIIPQPAKSAESGRWQVLSRHARTGLTSVACSHSGELFAVGSWDAAIRVYEMDGGDLRTILVGHEGGVTDIAWSPDDARLASSSTDRTVRVWNVASGTTETVLRDHRGTIRDIAWSPSGEFLVSACDDYFMRIWNRDGRLLHKLRTREDSMWSVAWSPDEKEIASSCHTSGEVIITDVATAQPSRKLNSSCQKPRLAWSPDGRWLLGAGKGESIAVWDREQWSLREVTSPHKNEISGVAWHPDGSSLITVSWDGLVCSWDVEQGLPILGEQVEVSGQSGVAWTPSGEEFLTTGSDGFVKIWNNELRLLASIGQQAEDPASFAWHPDGAMVAVSPGDKRLKVIDREGKLKFSPPCQPSWNAQLAWDESGRHLAIPEYGSIKILRSGADELIPLRAHEAGVLAVAWHSEAGLASASDDGKIILWNTKDEGESWTAQATWNHNCGRVWRLAWNKHGQLAAAAENGSVNCWDASGNLLFTTIGHAGRINAVAWSPDGEMLVSAGNDTKVLGWNREGQQIAQFVGLSLAANAVAFSPKGDRLATASVDRTLQIWSVSDATQLLTLDVGHPSRHVAWSQNGAELASIGDDRVLRFWDGATCVPKRVVAFLGDDESVTFSAGGKLLRHTPDALARLVRLQETSEGVRLTPVEPIPAN